MIVTKSTTTMSPKAALVVCLKNVAKKAAFVLLFRSLEDDTPSFHGIIRFNFPKKCLELIPDSDNRDLKTLIT